MKKYLPILTLPLLVACGSAKIEATSPEVLAEAAASCSSATGVTGEAMHVPEVGLTIILSEDTYGECEWTDPKQVTVVQHDF